MVKLARTAGLAIALCAFTAAPAHAVFSPELTVDLAPPTAAGAPALALMMSQPATDTPVERFTLSLPAGFRAAGAPAAPTGTQIGAFAARLGTTVPITGAITKTGATSFRLVLSVLGGAVSQTVEGTVAQRANGSLDLKLDQLPALPITVLALRFWGGDHSLIRMPGQCGNYTLDGKFTSRAGDLAIDRTLLPVTGCAGTPSVQVANVRLSATRFRAGGSVYGTRTVIAWWASRATDHTDVRVVRRVDGAWRRVGVLVATGNAGDNFVRWDGRVRQRALKPGRYGLRVQPDGSEPTQLVRFRIVD